jgi:NAD(P)H dehydrogenase (quinone)
MHVLIVIAHPSPASFCHAVLGQLTRGLADAGHTVDVVDLYAVKFDPVFGPLDGAFFADPTIPREVLAAMKPAESLVALSGNPIRRFLAKRWLKGKDLLDVVRLMANFRPKDVLAQQAKVARADGLVLIAPVYWMGFPAMLKGWVERVFSYGFAYALTPEGWDGHVSGRVPLLKLKKALVVSTTFFREEDYRAGGFDAAIARITDDWGLRYPGVAEVEHVYLYAPGAVEPRVRQEYLARAYRLGREFAATPPGDTAQILSATEDRAPEKARA